MRNKKGLSQILYLIIAASVLMIAALSLVFMLNEGLSGLIDFGGDAENTACERAIQASCSGLGSGTEVNVPSTCVDSNGNVIPPASNGAMDAIDSPASSPSDTLTCTGA